MQVVKQDFNERVSEINIYFRHLKNIINKEAQLVFPNYEDKRENIDVELTSILKSNSILLLYNLVESTISNSLDAIHQAFCDENLTYFELSDEVQKIWLRYYRDLQKKDGSFVDELKLIVETLSNNKTIQLTYQEYNKYKTNSSKFSGNLDAEQILDIAKRYGVFFDETIKRKFGVQINRTNKELSKIKDRRNKLAHGNISFAECCRLDDMRYIRKLKISTVVFLRYFIKSVEYFIDNKVYKR